MNYYCRPIHSILLLFVSLRFIQATNSIIPDKTCSSFGSYPNLLNITASERDLYHPVVLYPKESYPIKVTDGTNAQGLATREEIKTTQQQQYSKSRRTILRRIFQRVLRQLLELSILRKRLILNSNTSPQWNIGRYDENREQMYSSDIFTTEENPRTVHIGIDLGAPAGTAVYAFTDGIVHSSGYNAAYGDYGHVIIIKHTISSSKKVVYALYGHLSSDPKLPLLNTRIRKGQRIGRIGDCHENGGWIHPHLHFQLSLEPPSVPHDMPGACSWNDRPKVLLQYPDPRYVLGELY